MKNILHLLVISLFLSIIAGCEKAPPVVSPIEPTIEAWSDFSSIPYYESCIVTIKLKNTITITSDFPGSENISITEASKSIELHTPKLTKTIIYHFIAHGENGKMDSANVTINVNPPVAPTLYVLADNDTIVRGKSTTITWSSSTDSTSSPELSGVKGKFGSISVSPTETTIYHFISKNDGIVVSDSVTITVIDPPPPTLEELLSVNYGPWKKIKLEGQDASGLPWDPYDIWDCMKDNLFYFYLTPTKKMINDRGEITCSDDENRTSEGPWSLSGNIIVGLDCEILTLTKDTLVWVYVSGGGPGRVRETFIHP